MTAYGWFLSVVAIGPVLTLAAPRWRRYFPEPRGLVFVWLFASTPWLLLDAWQHAAGFWRYNPQLVSGGQVLGLPLEEALFFYLVPLACLVLWRVVVQYRPGRVLMRWGQGVAAAQMVLLLAMVAWFGVLPQRSFIDAWLMLGTAALVLLLAIRRQNLREIYAWTGVVALLFFLGNTYLTALPIVEYSDRAMVPWRLGTIPVSDIHYNFAFLWSVWLVYEVTSRRALVEFKTRSEVRLH